jgi:hypothetical protein
MYVFRPGAYHRPSVTECNLIKFIYRGVPARIPLRPPQGPKPGGARFACPITPSWEGG